MKPTNSICCCSFNRLDRLELSMESILKSASRPTEVIVVDDCSTEPGIREYLNEFKKKNEKEDFRIILHFMTENVGHCATQNASFELANTDILIHYESDIVVVQQGWNKIFEDYLRKYPELGLVGPFMSSRQDVIGRPLPKPSEAKLKEDILNWTQEDIDTYRNYCRNILFRNYINNVQPKFDFLECQWMLGGLWAIRKECYEATELVDGVKGWDYNLAHQRECLTGDTEVPLVDGTTETIERLYKKRRKNFNVYSMSPDGKIVSGLCKKVVLKGKRKVLKITLDNEESFECTSDHLIMLRDGSYKKAKDLESGDSVMPLYRNHNYMGYEKVYVPKYNKFVPTHVMMFDLKGKKRQGKVLHHKNFNPLDNRPDNIELLSKRDHVLEHTGDPESKRKRDLQVKKTWKRRLEQEPDFLEEVRERARKTAKKVWKTKRREIIEKGLISYPIEDRIKNIVKAAKDPSRAEKIRKTIASLPKEARDATSLKLSLRHKKFWKNLSGEERKEMGRKISSGNKESWNNLSESKKKERGEISSFYLKEFSKNVTEETRRSINKKISKSVSVYLKEFYKTVSKDWMDDRNKKISETLKRDWQNKSQEEKEEREKRLYLGTKKYWKKMSKNERSERNKRHSEKTSNSLKKFYENVSEEWENTRRNKISKSLKRAYAEGRRNHKVILVEKKATKKEVYDLINVSPHNNFAISFADGSGVFVHNCDWCLKVRMTPQGYKVGEIREFSYIHLGEGDAADTDKRKAQIREGVWNFLKKWNRRFLGYWDYDAIHAMSWDDFPPNVWFRRQVMSLMGWNRNPSQRVMPFGSGKWDEINILRPPGRENEKVLLYEMVNNKHFKDYGKLGDRDDVDWKHLLEGKEKEFNWRYKNGR